ncbi:MAG: hypothetical protein QNJ12_11775 [Ilumatobacter sp.]|uniref:hypothetical protein n=1 Tax=Ilumatobacter sp. TaxID=1967498 RepID=UPI00262399DE|nr:hypothetical protein [Ilumatobacter sp.]MDJ0769469.1 hypothetical protein [Ilumatobacter sp.]
MALLPRALRPSVLIRRKAIYAGLLGGSGFWRVVAVFVFGQGTIKKFFGKNPEVIDAASMGSGRYMQLTTTKPLSRRAKKKLRKAGVAMPTLKEERALAELWASSQRRAS